MSQRSSSAFGSGRILCQSTCPACGHHVAAPFYDGGQQPLATLAWPKSVDEARNMPRLPLSFVRCVDCGHVYNRDFDYKQVPYSDKPNLMFNKGGIWSGHLRAVRDLLLERLPPRPVVVEIGCGEGHLLRALAEACPDGRFVGFDPNAAIETGGRIEARTMLFEPERHLAEYRPHMIISRHVMEHLTNPLGFVQALAFAASWDRVPTRLFIEVPCIDHVFASGRTADFYYEHNSHFTTQSLHRMLSRCSTDVELIERSYGDEVVFGIARFAVQTQHVEIAGAALDFAVRARQTRGHLTRQLDALAASGKRVVIWGGTGKAAAFINQYGLDAGRFPTVVDSDPDKAGTFVPGTGQEIRHHPHLLEHPADVVLIATQWRAADIMLDIERTAIQCESVVLEYNGQLIDYRTGAHPYRLSSGVSRPHWGLRTATTGDASTAVD